MITIEEQSQHRVPIRDVITEAFGRAREADVVDRLRDAGDLVVSLVAVEEGSLAGHVALSRMRSPQMALGLAPVAVRKAAQRKGIGSALIREAIAAASRGGWRSIFVVGDPAYYHRFGFSAEGALGFQSRFAGPDFMALHFTDAAALAGRADYADAIENEDWS